MKHRAIPGKGEAIKWANDIHDKLLQQQDVATKFIRQLEALLVSAESDGYAQLNRRVLAAVSYFMKSMDEISASLQRHIKEVKIKQRVKKYLDELHVLEIDLKRKNKTIATYR